MVNRKPLVTSLYDLTPQEMESFFLSIGEKRYRAKQVLDFLYHHPVGKIDEMTTLPGSLRKRLSDTVRLIPLDLRTTVESSDGTIKHAYEVQDKARNKALLESVWMPADKTDVAGLKDGKNLKYGSDKAKRFTLCISSQLGCAAGCSFCATGALGLKAQLTTGEIVYQVVHSLALYGRLPDTVLFMGMGEPMHNFEAVSAAIEILTHPDGLGLSQRRIVVSTSGELERLGATHRKFPKIRLAISLNAATDALRSKIMPVNKKFNLKAIAAFISSLDASGRDKVTLEYVVLAGVNDSPDHVRKLSGYLKPITRNVKVNLIPYNPVKGSKYKTPPYKTVLSIQQKLIEIGVSTFIRRNRGREAMAACGQLGGK
jgi:23S rRNA (adenine2503-C2)-methyltransferase